MQFDELRTVVNYSCTGIDQIEYDVTVQISALQHGVCVRVHGCVRTCAVEIKPGMLRVACLIDVHVWTRIRFALQDGDFHSKNRVIQYGLLLAVVWEILPSPSI